MVRPLKNLYEVAVIGAGLAGLAAARQATRLGRRVTLFEASGLYGGQVATVETVDGLPIPGHFSGQALANHLLADLRKAGAQVSELAIANIELGERLTLIAASGQSFRPETVIIASGASLRRLGVPGEADFEGRGLSHCADCDGGFFRDRDVVVVGGGDAAAQQALLLVKTSRRVIMVCRSPMKARRDYVDKLAAQENVTFLWDQEVSAILGDDGVSGVRLRNAKDGSSSEVACAGLFPFIGVTPNTDFAPAALRTTSGHIRTDAELATSDARVFAAGAARANYGGALVQAMAEGVGAAEAAARRLVH